MRDARDLSLSNLVSPQGFRKSAGEFFSPVPFQDPTPGPTESETLRTDICIWEGAD